MYIKRHLEKTLAKAENMFGTILVTGSRQVGKTTLLSKALCPPWRWMLLWIGSPCPERCGSIHTIVDNDDAIL